MTTVEKLKAILRDSLQLAGRADSLTAASPLLGAIPEFDSMAVVAVLTMIEDEFGITVVSVSRSGRNIFNPGPDVQLFPADRLILSGEPDKLALAVDYLTRVEFADDGEQDFAVEELRMATAPLWHRRTLADLDLRNRFGVSVVAVRRLQTTPTSSAPAAILPGCPVSSTTCRSRRAICS